MASTKARWIIGGAVLVGILLLVSENNNINSSGSDSRSEPSGGDGSGRCMVIVTVDSLNALSRPDGDAEVVETYAEGSRLVADRTSRRDGFRQLGPDRWAAEDSLEPTPGSDCG